MRFIHDFFRNYEFELSENPKDSMIYIGMSNGYHRSIVIGKDMDTIKVSMIAACLTDEDFCEVLLCAANSITMYHNEGIYTMEDYANKRMKGNDL